MRLRESRAFRISEDQFSYLEKIMSAKGKKNVSEALRIVIDDHRNSSISEIELSRIEKGASPSHEVLELMVKVNIETLKRSMLTLTKLTRFLNPKRKEN